MSKLLPILFLLFLLSSCAQRKQNFVFILVDDLGWKDLGYAGSTFYETPHIDSLSRESLVFTRAYASGSVCSPSRAAILTGQHPARLQITDWIPGANLPNQRLITPEILNQLPLKVWTLAEALQAKGYTTFFAGKWHLGGEGYYPEQQGFAVNRGGHEKGSPPGGYYVPYNNPRLSDGPQGEYLTDRLTSESIHFLDTIGDNPFFLYLNFYTVHTPIQANKQYVDKFEQKLSTLEVQEPRTRPEGQGITNLVQDDPAYASMVYALDVNIGRLIDKLKERGLYDHTTLVFTSDNGGLATLARGRRRAPTAVVPLRGGKGWLYEGGIRVPLLIKPAGYSGEGRKIDEPVVGHDFYPTILAQAGIAPEAGVALDGVDLSPLLAGEDQLERNELYWHYPHYHGSAWTPGAALLQDDWKLIEFYETNTVELYNLSEEMAEQNDLSLKYPEKVSYLRQRLRAWQDSIGAGQVRSNPNFVAESDEK